MSINFKPGTTPGETIEEGGITWEWDGQKWNRHSPESTTNEYVKVGGDTMTGALVMDDAGEIEMQSTNLDFRPVGESLKDTNGNPILIDHNDGNGLVEQWDPANERFSTIKSASPRLFKSDGSYGANTKQEFGIRVEIDDGNTYKNQFKVANRHDDIVQITGGANAIINFGSNFPRNDSNYHGIVSGVVIKGIPTPDKELTPGNFAVNKQYVDVDQKRQDDALEAEIEARADRDLSHDAEISTLEYKLDALLGIQFKGEYTFKHDTNCDEAFATCMAAAGSDTTAQGQCATDLIACEDAKVTSGTFEAVDPDDRFDNLVTIVIHKNDVSNQELEWDSILKADDYLEIDHQGPDGLDKQNYGLYRLTGDPVEATNAQGEPVFNINLEFLQGSGVLTEDENYEVRGITAAEGISPDELGDFLLKDEAANLYASINHHHDDRYHKKNSTNGGNYFVTANHQEILKSDYHAKGNNTDILLNDHTTKAQSDFASSTHDHGSTYVKNENSADIKISKTSNTYYITGG